jgi:hypothetical protein
MLIKEQKGDNLVMYTKPIEREVGEFEIISTLVQNQTQRNSMLVKKQVRSNQEK